MKTWPTGMCLNELINRSRLALDHLSSFLKRFVLSIRASFDFFKKVSQMTIKFIVWKLIYLFSPAWRIFHDITAPNNCRCFYLNRYFNLCADISHRTLLRLAWIDAYKRTWYVWFIVTGPVFLRKLYWRHITNALHSRNT